jgi:DNA mismatch repair protein MutS2
MHELLDKVKREKKKGMIKRVERTQQYIDKKLETFRKEPVLSIDDIKEGKVVFVKSLGYDVTIDNIDKLHNRLRVKTGKMDVEVPISDVSPKKDKLPEKGYTNHRIIDTETSIHSTLNIIGLRVDKAISDVERFLNQATIAELQEVTIIHGIGTGALMKAVHQHLDGHPLIKKYKSSDQPGGGRGVTVVKMR